MERYFIENISALRLEIYTIGYAEKGESQIILLRHEKSGTLYFSCVIDCFCTNDLKVTVDILSQNKIANLDYFIWTHTDEDHSLGIFEVIEHHCGDQTQYIIPEGVSGNQRDFIDYNAHVKSIFDRINSFNKGQSYRVHTASVVKGGHSTLFKRRYIDATSGIELNFEALAIAPLSAIIRRRWEQGGVKKKNDLSIATILKCGELSLLFSGDIENQTIQHIPDYYLEDLTYIKIPHHTSMTSTLLLEKLQRLKPHYKSPTSITTTNKKYHLPNRALLKQYLTVSENIYTTGNGKCGYGYLKSVYDIINNEIIDETCFGDSILEFSNA